MVARADLEVILRARDRLTPTLRNVESSIIRFVGAVSAALAGFRVVTFPVQQAAQFDRAMRDVQKTTGFTDQQIRGLSAGLLDLSRGLSTSAIELASIAAAAGQLGLGGQGREAIEAFTQSVARAATTLDLTADVAARNLATIATVFQIPIKDTERLVSQINELSNTTVASAKDLIDVIKRIGPTARLTNKEVAALGATAISLGVTPEVAGTSLVKVFSNLESKADQFAEELGISVGEFLEQGALDRFRSFLSLLINQSDDARAKLIRKLAGGGRIFALVNKFVQDAGNGFALLDQNLQTSSDSFDEGQSAIREYEAISRSVVEQVKQLRNNFTANASTIGQTLLPEILKLVKRLKELLQQDEVISVFESIGQAMLNTFNAVVRLSEALPDNIAFWKNLIQVIKLFIGLQLVRILTVSTLRLFAFAAAGAIATARFAGLNRVLQTTTALQIALAGPRAIGALLVGFTRLPALLGRGAAALGTLARAGSLLSRIAIFSVPGVIVTGLVLIATNLDKISTTAANFIREVGTSLLNLVGLQTQTQAEAEAQARTAARTAREEAQRAATAIEEARSRLEGGQLQTEPVDFGAGIENVDDVQEAISRAADTVGTLNAAIAGTAQQTQTLDDEWTIFLQRVAGAQADFNIAQNELKELIDTFTEEGGEAGPRSDELEDQIVVAQRNLSVQRSILETLQMQADVTSEAKDRLEEQAAGFAAVRNEALLTLRNLLSDDAIDALGLSIRRLILETGRDAKDTSERSIDDISKRIAEINTELDTADVDTRVNLLVDRNELEAELRAVQSEAKNLEDTVNEIFKLEGVTAAERTLVESIVAEGDIEKLEGIVIQLQEIKAQGIEAGSSVEEVFGRSAGEILATSRALERANEAAKIGVEEAEKAFKVAKGVFDNTFAEIQALKKAVFDLDKEITSKLAERRISIRFDRREAGLDREIEELEERREQITAEFDERIANARTNAERLFIERRREEALRGVTREEEAIQQRRDALQRRQFRARLDLAREQIEGFIRQSQAAAERGDLTEALGFKELAKTGLRDALGLINEMAGATEGVGEKLRSAFSDREITNAVQDISRVGVDLEKALPEVNRTLSENLKDSFEEAKTFADEIAKSFKAAAAEVEKLQTLFPQITDAAVRQFNELFDESAIAGNINRALSLAQTRQGVGGGGVDPRVREILQEQLDVLEKGFAGERLAPTVAGLAPGDVPRGAAAQEAAERLLAADLNRAINELRGAGQLLVEGVQLDTNIARLQSEVTNKANQLEERRAALQQRIESGFADEEAINREQQSINDDAETLLRAQESLLAAQRLEGAEAGGVRDIATTLGRIAQLEDQRQRAAARLRTGDPDAIGEIAEIDRVIESLRTGLPRAIEQLPQAVAGLTIAPDAEPVAVPEATVGRVNLPTDETGALPIDAATIQNLGLSEEAAGQLQSSLTAIATNALNQAASNINGGAAPTGGVIPGAAGGGLVSGPGSGKSDSILARLSNGEFVIDAFTRKFFGSGFFSNLQSLAKSGRGIKLPGFATGGPVGGRMLSIPNNFQPVAAAVGAGGAPVHIHLPGGDTVKLREGDTSAESVKRIFRREAAKRGKLL